MMFEEVTATSMMTCGATVAEAFFYMYYLEKACRIQVQVLAGGRPTCRYRNRRARKARRSSNRGLNKSVSCGRHLCASSIVIHLTLLREPRAAHLIAPIESYCENVIR